MPESNAMLPMGLLLLGLACVSAFMAFRPWPVTAGTPLQPGMYFIEILSGKPPATESPYGGSAQQQTDIAVIQSGLMAIFIIWAISKLTQFLTGMPGIPASGGGGEEEGGEEGTGEDEGGAEEGSEGGGIGSDIEGALGDIEDTG